MIAVPTETRGIEEFETPGEELNSRMNQPSTPPTMPRPLEDYFSDVCEAHRRIRDSIHRTPVLTSSTFDREWEGSVFWKCENFQKTGSFKIRGATNALGTLSEEEASRGVVAHSSGNHAQAVARAAQRAGIQARIVMPEDSSPVKIRATRGYGAEVTLCPPTLEGRETVAQELLDRHGSVLIHPFDDDRILAGQATAAKELLEEVPDLDLLLAPVSGGGLLSGTAIAAKSLRPSISILGCEPLHADDAHRSLRSGRLEPASDRRTIADGLRATLSLRTFRILSALVDDVLTVTEPEILAGMRSVWERMKIVIEPSSAVVVAALQSGRVDVRGKKVGAILSGGNLDLGPAFESFSIEA